MYDDWIIMKKIEWVSPVFEPEIDLNFLGLDAKVSIKPKKEQDES
jgi:hypothetical protein